MEAEEPALFPLQTLNKNRQNPLFEWSWKPRVQRAAVKGKELTRGLKMGNGNPFSKQTSKGSKSTKN